MRFCLRQGQFLFVVLSLALLCAVAPAQAQGSGDSPISHYTVPTELSDALPQGADTLHDYGGRLLVRLPSGRMPADLLPRVSELEPLGHLNYRNWRGLVDGHEPSQLPATGDDYFLLALIGPMDPAWRQAISAAGLSVVDHVNPYGVLVRGSSEAVSLAAESVRTTTGLPVVTHALVRPEQSRVSSDMQAWLAGRSSADQLGIRVQGERALVRLEFHADAEFSGVHHQVVDFLEPGPEFVAGGASAQYLASRSELQSLLDEVPEVAFVHGVYPKELHNNIGVQEHITNIEPVWTDLGYTGLGLIAGVNDGGLDLEHDDFPAGSVVATQGAMSGTDNGHGTHVTGTVAGRGAAPSPENTSGCGDVTEPLADARGVAWEAQVTHNNLFDGGITDETAMMQWQFQQGALVNNNSWGYGSFVGPVTTYDAETVAVDAAVRDADASTGDINDQLAIVFSAGNSATAGVSKPANGKNVITVGASQNDRCGSYVPTECAGPDINGMACFSSQGPSQGRIKPDIVAPGTDVLSTGSSDPEATWGGWDQGWTGEEYAIVPGTSMSAPMVTGAATLFFQHYQAEFSQWPSPALVKAALINTATSLGGDFPSNIQGWGRINLRKAIEGPVEDGIVYFDQDQVDHLQTADAWSTEIGVASSDEPFRVTLTWTDPPGAAGCNPCHINDLDLTVTAPDGTVYRGNQFDGAWSQPDPTGRDEGNNVENVYVEAPVSGDWTVEVSGFNVALNPNLLDGQDFALVGTGDFGGLSIEPVAAEACTADGSIDYSIVLSSQFEGTTNLSASGLPGGTSGSFNPNPVVFPDTESLFTLSDLGMASGGEYTLTFTATDAGDSSNTAENDALLTLYEDVPGQVMLVAPPDGATDVDLQPQFDWNEPTEPASYQIQVATDAGFADIVIDEIVNETSFVPEADLATGTDYFWRVRSANACGDGAWSASATFQTRFEPIADIAPLSFAMEVVIGDTVSDTLSISNVGTGNLVWDIYTDSLESTASVAARGHDPSLDEAFEVPEFTVAGSETPEAVEFTFDGGVLTRGEVVGFSFIGTASGLDGSGSWASDTCMVLEAPDGTTFGVGGFGSTGTIPGCTENDWDFQGSGSSGDGTYESVHDDIFAPPLGDEGQWTLTFINDWASSSAGDITWSDVTVTLLKQPLPVCIDGPVSVPWLSATPSAGSTGAGLTDEVTVTADASTLNQDVHVGYLCVETNDTSASNLTLVPIPVEVTVFDPDSGALEGTVTTQGHCNADDPQPLAGALVTIQGQSNTFDVTTDSNGFYSININENESPLDVTVSADGYLDVTATGVVVAAGSTTTQDFAIQADASCATVTPESYAFDLLLGDTANDNLEIGNVNGNVDLDWTLEVGTDGTEACEGEAPWLTVNPTSGTTIPGNSDLSQVSVDTSTLADGLYEAQICVGTNDPEVGVVIVPVELLVTDPELGTLQGAVMAEDCAADPQPLADAEISIVGQIDNYTTTTDADGFYSIKVHQDDSPVDVTASAEGYLPSTEEGVVISGMTTTEVNFSLTLDAACIDTNPDQVSATVDLGQTQDVPFDILNFGTQDLNWQIVLPEAGPGLAAMLADERDAPAVDAGGDEAYRPDPIEEAAGFDNAPSTGGPGEPIVTGQMRQQLLQEGVVLIPQSSNDRIMAFDPESGALIDENFITYTEDLGTLQHVLPHPDGERLLVVSQSDAVHEFSVEGDYLGVFAPIGGPDSSIMDNTRGLAFHPDTGNLLVTSASGDNSNTVVEFDLDGNFLGTFIESGSGGITGPWSIQFRDADILVSASGGNIYRYDHAGAFLDVWNDEINFPEQIAQIDNGNVLAAAFSSPSGVWELDPDGNQIAIYGPETGLRGVYELPTGNILTTNSGGVHEIDRDGNLVETKIAGSSHQISFVQTINCEIPPWLSFDQTDGTVVAGDPPTTITLTFDPAGMAPGDYEGNFCIESNDPVQSTVQIPVDMTAVLPADWGVVEGTVESLGYCDENPAPLAGATVEIVGAESTQVLQTDENGFYQTFLPETESPLDINVSADNHFGDSRSASFVGGDVVVEDFSLLLDEPCASVRPDGIDVTMDPDEMLSGLIELSNADGNASLTWQIDTAMPTELERQPAAGALPGGGSQYADGAGPVSLSSVLGQKLPSVEVVAPNQGAVDCESEPGLVVHDDGTVENGYTWGPANTWGSYVDRFTPSNYPASIDAVCLALVRASGGPASIDFEIVIYDDNGPGGSPGTELAAVQATVDDLPVWPVSSPSWASYDISEAGVEVASGSVYIGARWTPSDPNVYLAADESTDRPVGYAGGYSASDVGSEGAWEPVESGLADYRALFVRAVEGVIDCSDPVGVPWLDFNPAFGVLDAGETIDIEVGLDSSGLAPGEYSAGLCIFSDDPVNPVLTVPVDLTVRVPTDWATIEGAVESAGYCGGSSQPLANATVEITGAQSTYTAQTDASGNYAVSMPAEESPVDITANAAEHQPDTVSGIGFGPGDVITQDFSLQLEAACATVDPASLDFTLATGDSIMQELTISNVDGGADLNWLIEEAPPIDTQAHFPSWSPSIEHKDPAGSSAALDPAGTSPGGMSPWPTGEVLVPAYSTTGWTAPGYVTLDATVPDALTVINAEQPTNIYSAAFVDNDFGQHYMVASADGDLALHTFGTTDTATGEFTSLGTLTGDLPDSWTSMAWDHQSGTLFAAGTTATGNMLYVIDPGDLTSTSVGPIDGSGMNPDAIVIAIAISPEGLMYGIDIIDDVLIAIDKETAEASVIGSLGFDANFAQDMDFDQSTGILYWAGYFGSGDSQMLEVDTETGSATSLGATTDGAELLSFTIAIPGASDNPCAETGDVDWLSVDPVEGTTAAGEQSVIEVTADASGLAPGMFEASLCIGTDDAEQPLIVVPVTLEVGGPTDDLIFEDRFEVETP